MRNDVLADMAWLDENAVTWSIEVNPERAVYEPRAEYLDYIDAEEPREPLLAAPNLYDVRAYPSTPVGFVRTCDTNLADAVRRLREEIA